VRELNASAEPLFRRPRTLVAGDPARRATDVEVMEVLIDLEGVVPLLPRMRVDTFFLR
jgi:hypothetical protein